VLSVGTGVGAGVVDGAYECVGTGEGSGENDGFGTGTLVGLEMTPSTQPDSVRYHVWTLEYVDEA
jgi:sugar (pentulose or hexulose) kinase